MKRRDFLRGAAFSPLALVEGAAYAQPPTGSTPKNVVVVVDFSPTVSDPMPLPSPTPSAAPLTEWEKWAGFDDGSDSPVAALTLTPSPPGLVLARAVRNSQNRSVGIAVTNPTDQPLSLRLDTRLGSGLWRVEAAAISPVDPPKTWRMESVLRSTPGAVVKALPLQAGQTLFLRWAETVCGAERALQKLRTQTAPLGVTTYSGESVPRALERVAEVLSVLPTFIEKNKRPDVIKRVHRALLTVAQAEAMAQNDKQAQIDERDAAFDALTLALSEISCAAWNLVPRQVLEPGANSSPSALRVSLTNAGTRTLPLVSLAVEGLSGGEARNARPVFQNVAPSRSVSARFVLRDGDETTARGVAQFIVDMGAASVYAQPSPNPAAADVTAAAAP